MQVARCAGIAPAAVAIALRSAATAASVSESVGLMPATTPLSTEAKVRAPLMPNPIPRSVSLKLLRTVSARTWPGVAPSAIRNPISCLRCSTASA